MADSTTGTAVGQIGLWLRDVREGRATIGYWVAASHRRRGWAGRELALVAGWGLQLPEVHRLQLYVEPWNTGSWRAAEAAGFQREGLLRGWQQVGAQRRDMHVYSRLRTDDRGALPERHEDRAAPATASCPPAPERPGPS